MATKKQVETFGDSLMFKPTLRTLLYQYLEQKLFNSRRAKRTVYKEGALFFPEEDRLKHLPLIYIALVSNNKVEEMIRLNEETANIILSKKTKLVQFDPSTTIVRKGMTFNKEDGSFSFKENDEQKG